MPNWICPFCRAKMTVKPELIGQVKPCVKCSEESIVKDSDKSPTPLEPFPDNYPRFTRASEALSNESQHDNAIGNIARGTLLAITAICILYGIVGESNGQSNTGFPLACGVLFLAAILWPIYTMARDTRANRRLLEKIARSNER